MSNTVVQNTWGATANQFLEFTLMQCGNCGIPFMVPVTWKNKKVEEHGDFHCPNGCSRRFVAETEADRLKRQLESRDRIIESKNRDINYWNEKFKTEQHSKRTIKGHHTRLKNKIQNGICPCCDKEFTDLAAHMANSHPDFQHNKNS